MIAPPLAGRTLGSVANDFVIAEWQDGGGVSAEPRLIAPLHTHFHDDEAWYTLEGVLCVRIGNDEFELRAGSGVLVPRGTPHTYWNPGNVPARYLITMTPNIFRLISALHSMTDRSKSALKALFREHNSELLE